jgi:hypothetical protein
VAGRSYTLRYVRIAFATSGIRRNLIFGASRIVYQHMPMTTYCLTLSRCFFAKCQLLEGVNLIRDWPAQTNAAN